MKHMLRVALLPSLVLTRLHTARTRARAPVRVPSPSLLSLPCSLLFAVVLSLAQFSAPQAQAQGVEVTAARIVSLQAPKSAKQGLPIPISVAFEARTGVRCTVSLKDPGRGWLWFGEESGILRDDQQRRELTLNLTPSVTPPVGDTYVIEATLWDLRTGMALFRMTSPIVVKPPDFVRGAYAEPAILVPGQYSKVTVAYLALPEREMRIDLIADGRDWITGGLFSLTEGIGQVSESFSIPAALDASRRYDWFVKIMPAGEPWWAFLDEHRVATAIPQPITARLFIAGRLASYGETIFFLNGMTHGQGGARVQIHRPSDGPTAGKYTVHVESTLYGQHHYLNLEDGAIHVPGYAARVLPYQRGQDTDYARELDIIVGAVEAIERGRPGDRIYPSPAFPELRSAAAYLKEFAASL